MARGGREVALRLGNDNTSTNFGVRNECRVVIVEVVEWLEGGVHGATVWSLWDEMGCLFGDFPGRGQ